MSLHTHLAMLQEKHTKLESMLGDELHRPWPDLNMMQTLKKQKLLIKEEMERVRIATLQRREAA